MCEASEDQAAVRLLRGEAAEEAVERDSGNVVAEATGVPLRGNERLGRDDLRGGAHSGEH